jgi:hypothetical protein
MDRRQMLVQRVREFFGERLDDVLEMVRQDRQELRGWQEPAHFRGVLRRLAREEGGGAFPVERGATAVADRPAELEFGRTAGEPDRAQQREATGQLLEAGGVALQKAVRGQGADLGPEETLGLEFVLLLYGRPALPIVNGSLAGVPSFWNVLEDQRDQVERAQRGVGRVELLGHPEFDWTGTGFLVSERVLMTTRRIAELFTEPRYGGWQFRPGISAWMNYRPGYQDVASAGFRVRGVIGVHDRYDLALFEVERPAFNGTAPAPLSLATQPPPGRSGRPVYVIGYPVRDARRNEPERVARVFRDVYNVKRVQPGVLRGEFTFHEVTFLQHDAAPLGQNAGAPVLDLETHQVIGLQTTGRYLEASTAVPLYLLRDDPLLRDAGVTFAEATTQDRQAAQEQLERLARSRFWTETRSALNQLYQRAFGEAETNR